MTDLNWFGWLLVGLFSLSTLISISQVGKRRNPLEPGSVVISTILNGLLIAGVLFIGTVS